MKVRRANKATQENREVERCSSRVAMDQVFGPETNGPCWYHYSSRESIFSGVPSKLGSQQHMHQCNPLFLIDPD